MYAILPPSPRALRGLSPTIAMLRYALVACIVCKLLVQAWSPPVDVEVILDANGGVVDHRSSDPALVDATERAAYQEHEVAGSTAPEEPPATIEPGLNTVGGVTLPPMSWATAEDGHFAMLAVLHTELEAVNEMVKLQEKKLEMLGNVRATWLKEYKEVVRRTKVLGKIRHKTRPDFNDIIHQKLDLELASVASAAADRAFDMGFVEEAVIPLEGPVGDVQMTKLCAPSALDLVVVAYNNGVVAFYVTPNEEVLRMDTERRGITSVALSTEEGQPCLVVVYEGSAAAIYALELSGNGRRLIGVKGETAVVEAQKTPSFTSPAGSKYVLRVAELGLLKLSTEVLVVTIAQIALHKTVAVAQDNGVVEFFALNGTRVHEIRTAASIRALATRRNVLAFSNGTGVVVSSMLRTQEVAFQSCPGSSALITSIAFDAEYRDILYAGTERGEVLVYTLAAAALDTTQACRLHSRAFVSKSTRDQGPAALVAAKGFLMAATASQITVFNASRPSHSAISLAELCTRPLRQIGATSDASMMKAPKIAFTEGPHSSKLAWVATSQDGEPVLTLFHTLLGRSKDVADLEWSSVFYAGLIVVAVLGSQYYFRRQHRAGVNPYDTLRREHGLDLDPYGCKFGGTRVRGIQGSMRDTRRDMAGLDKEALDDCYSSYDSLSNDIKRKIAATTGGATQDMIEDPEF